jgi:dienelactone hydrolase
MKKTLSTSLVAATTVGLLTTGLTAASAEAPTTASGQLPDGTAYSVAVPADWNGDAVVLVNRPQLTGGYVSWLQEQGYALVGYDLSDRWDLERDVANATEALNALTATTGAPGEVILTGRSQGGLVTRLVTEADPAWLDAALPMCGGGAGAISMWNAKLDTAFALAITGIDDVEAENTALRELTEAAQSTPEGRARLVLAAALSKIPADDQATGTPLPAADLDARVTAYAANLPLAVGAGVRAGFEDTIGGTFSWNDGVDYRQELRASGRWDEVKAAYRAAGADLETDLDALAQAPRITADLDAVATVERIGTYTGRLDVPVLSLHTTGDPAGPTADEAAYASVVRAAGDNAQLRQTFVRAAGHCTFTDAEQVTATQTLIDRLETRHWPSTNPRQLDDRATELDTASNLNLGDSRFTTPTPAQPARPWDARNWGTY